jgi:hypothetical protein
MRFEVGQPSRMSQVVGRQIVTCYVGPHCADTDWPGWAPWDALEGAPGQAGTDGRHPSVTVTPMPRARARRRRTRSQQLRLPFD